MLMADAQKLSSTLVRRNHFAFFPFRQDYLILAMSQMICSDVTLKDWKGICEK